MRKILYAILPIALALTLAVGVAFSAWRLEALDKSQTSLTDKRDDIFENYDIKKADETQVNRVNTYTMYLYPSTLYLNDYADYINGVDGAVLPEEKYGYIEPVVARDGAVSYNVVDKNGGDGSYLKDVANNGSYVMSDEKRTLGMLYSVYAKNSVWNKREGNELSDITYNWAGTTVYGDLKFLYGDPVLDKTTVEYTESTTGADLQDGGSGERHGWRNLHYYDRFGYWTTLAKGEGRYLPLKITVDENFSNTYYDSVVMSPFSDMGDPRDWYVYTFSCWAYVAYDATSDSYALPYYATAEFANSNSGTNYVSKASNGSVVANPSLGSFCPTTVSQYFDIIESFEKYTDENGVIRLFPKFSNGKGYAANSIKDGGGDAIKVIPETKGADGGAAELDSLDQHELYMFYSTETGSVTDNGTSVPVNVSVLPNIDIDKYYSLNFMVAPETSLHGWLSWTDIYSLDRQETKDSNKNITDTLQSYGYGLYNLYFFITDVGSSTSSNDCRDGLETLRQNLVKKDTSLQGSFPTLYGKNLLPIASVYVQFVENSQYYGKSFMLVAEKVREAKFIGDVNFGGTNNTTEQELQDKYLSTDKSFRLINQTLYGIENNSDTESAINSQFPYCYILQNVDFTEATTPYCQIRFQRAYRSDLHFATTDEYRYNRIKFSGETYVQGFGEEGYFTLEEVNNQQVIKLNSSEERGVYDIILVFRSARENSTGAADDNRAYNIGLFAYRHTNIFLKIFDGDLTDKINYYQGDGGAIAGSGTGTAYEFIDHTSESAQSKLLFDCSYPIGVSVKSTDKDASGNTIAKCVNNAVVKKGGALSDYKLYDHVTGAEVAHYEERTGTEIVAGTDYLEYGGKHYELVFEPFKIRKNYIFYIS